MRWHSLHLRVRLNRLQTNSGNQFPENSVFGCHGKYYFPEIDFLLTEIFSLDHGKWFLSSFSLQLTSGKRERERERERRESPDQRERGTIAPTSGAVHDRDRRSSGAIDDRDRRAQTSAIDEHARLSSIDDRDGRAALVGRAFRRIWCIFW